MKNFTAEVTGFAPSSAIQIPLFSKNEILNPIPVFGRLNLKKPKPTKLPPNQSNQIVERHHSGQSLRELAAEFGVSHETIRTIIKHHKADPSQEGPTKTNQEGDSFMLDST